MHRNDLLGKLDRYFPKDKTEQEFKVAMRSFVRQNEDCFLRTLETGHVTGSAWIVNKAMSKAILTHHLKLNKWLQLGGHADGESDIIRVSTKEAEEESGLSSIKLISPGVFDIDIHTIPARKSEPEHLHYDVRFLFTANEHEPLVVSHESKDLAWVSFEKLAKMTLHNESIHRMMEKCRLLQKKEPLKETPI